MLRYLTAGESHGPMLTAILEGIPANLSLVAEEINLDLGRRQRGYGRGGRMRIEKDEANIVGGVRHGGDAAVPERGPAVRDQPGGASGPRRRGARRCR